MIKPTGSPGRTLKAILPKMKTRIRSKAYKAKAACKPTNLPTNPRITTVLAAHGIKTTTKAAKKRSRSVSIILQPIHAGTLHP